MMCEGAVRIFPFLVIQYGLIEVGLSEMTEKVKVLVQVELFGGGYAAQASKSLSNLNGHFC